MSRRNQPLFLRVSIGLALVTAALTSTARADPSILTHLGIGAVPAPQARAQAPDHVPRLPADGRAPSTSPAETTSPRIGTAVAGPTAPSSASSAKPRAADTGASDRDDRAAIFAAVRAEQSSWAEVQKLLRQQPAIADTPIYHEIARFQATVPAISDPASTSVSTKAVSTKDGDPLAGRTRGQRRLLLLNLTTQNVVLQTLVEQVSAAHLDGWLVSGQNSARRPGESAQTTARHLLA